MHREDPPKLWQRTEVGCLSFVLAFVVFFFWFGMAFFTETNEAWLALAAAFLVFGMFIFRRSWLMWTVVGFVAVSVGAFLVSL